MLSGIVEILQTFQMGGIEVVSLVHIGKSLDLTVFIMCSHRHNYSPLSHIYINLQAFSICENSVIFGCFRNGMESYMKEYGLIKPPVKLSGFRYFVTFIKPL